MVKIDLITGFLGSGKTTFIKEYAQNQDGRNNNSKHKTARTDSDVPVDCGIIATVAYHSKTCGNRINVC